MKTRENRKAQAAKLIEPWKASGLSVKKFCSQMQFSEYTFRYWLKRLAPKKQSRKETGFIPLQINQSMVVVGDKIEIHYPNGIQIKLSAGTNPAIIQSLITML